mmetsp:Transcript_17016/g.38230  ORF Transcript_17016/g.38230 Transcript_17016/m.38230 type:complete len:219 (+) Transcript_17016:258-914(+)
MNPQRLLLQNFQSLRYNNLRFHGANTLHAENEVVGYSTHPYAFLQDGVPHEVARARARVRVHHLCLEGVLAIIGGLQLEHPGLEPVDKLLREVVVHRLHDLDAGHEPVARRRDRAELGVVLPHALARVRLELDHLARPQLGKEYVLVQRPDAPPDPAPDAGRVEGEAGQLIALGGPEQVARVDVLCERTVRRVDRRRPDGRGGHRIGRGFVGDAQVHD